MFRFSALAGTWLGALLIIFSLVVSLRKFTNVDRVKSFIFGDHGTRGNHARCCGDGHARDHDHDHGVWMRLGESGSERESVRGHLKHKREGKISCSPVDWER